MKAVFILVASLYLSSISHGIRINVDNGEHISTFSVVGSANMFPSDITLTPSQTFSAGASFYLNPITLNSQGFSASFSFWSDQGGVPGDGVTFTLSPSSSSVGYNGGALGFAGLSDSFAVAFTIYETQNTKILKTSESGTVSTLWSTTSLGLLEKLNRRYVSIEYNWQAKTLTIVQTQISPQESVTHVANDIDLSFLNNRELYFGFTASTGLAYSRFRILNGINNEIVFNIDLCATNNGGCSINAQCTNTDGSRTCSCNSGYSGDGITCSPRSCSSFSGFPETQSGQTSTINNCPSGQYGSSSCSCSFGVWGSITSNCQTCPSGYSSPPNSQTVLSCTDIDECLINNGGCSPNAKCNNTDGSRECSCLSGFTGNGISCEDINECLTNNGNCLQGCINTIGSRNCSCFPGYTLNGVRCIDFNECRVNNGGCDSRATCFNTDGSRTCSCIPGYQGDGLTCTDINECLTNNGGCHSFANCVNTEGSRHCNCPPGYIGNGYNCSNRKISHYSIFSPITRFSFDANTQDEVRLDTFASVVGSAQIFSIYQRNIPGNQALRLDGNDNIVIPPVTLGVDFTFEVVFNTNSYPTSPTLSDILTVFPQGKSLRSEAMLIISIDSNGKIIRSSNGVTLSTSKRIVRPGVTHSFMCSFKAGKLVSFLDGINLGTINFNNHVADSSYEIQSGLNFDGHIDEIGAFNVALGVNHLYSITLCKNPCPSGQICVNLLTGESCAQRIF